MDLDELRSVQSKERRKDSLQHLRDSFYDDVAAYIAERKRRRDERAASVDSPFSDERVRKLSDEIETAEEVVESLYERRVGKVVKLSSFAAAGAPTETDGMTIQEAELFEDLVHRIETNKRRVLDVLEGGGDVDIDAPGTPAPSESAGAGAAEAAPAPEAAPTGGERGTDAPAAGDATAASDAAGGTDGDGGVLADAMGGGNDTAAEPSDGAPETGETTDAGAAAGTGATDATDAADATDASGAGGAGEPAGVSDETAPGEFVPGTEPDRAGGIEGGDEAPEGTPAAADQPATEPAGAAAAAPDSATGSDGTGSDRRTVRITSDVGTILGVDEIEYDLAAEDVVTLPTANAAPLVERDAAEPID